jgi:hypothetical protein
VPPQSNAHGCLYLALCGIYLPLPSSHIFGVLRDSSAPSHCSARGLSAPFIPPITAILPSSAFAGRIAGLCQSSRILHMRSVSGFPLTTVSLQKYRALCIRQYRFPRFPLSHHTRVLIIGQYRFGLLPLTQFPVFSRYIQFGPNGVPRDYPPLRAASNIIGTLFTP